MVNRILIRNKVIHTLYSYFLTKSEFRVESEPDEASKEKHFAYVVYVNSLNLLFLLNGLKTGTPSSAKFDFVLSINGAKTKLIQALFKDEKLKMALADKSLILPESKRIAESLHNKIVNSTPYRSFVKNKSVSTDDELNFWKYILSDVFPKDEALISALRSDENFSISATRKGVQLAAATLESFKDSRFTLFLAEKELDKSLDKAHELYMQLLLLPVELTRMRELQIDAAKHKLLPTYDDLNPDTKFIDNRLPALIKRAEPMKDYLKEDKNPWIDDRDFLKRLLDIIMQSDTYREYMGSEESSQRQDCDFWKKVMKSIILPSDELAELLESKSVYWNDDLEIIGTFVIKTIRATAKENALIQILPKFKDRQDEEFGSDLFRLAATHFDEYRELIFRFINVSSWDPERIAFMDIVIMVAAITEIVHFPTIALPVSINEYIEIANTYSTNRSGQFINGVLHSVTNYLRDNGKLIGK